MVLLTKDSLETRSVQTHTQICVHIHRYTPYPPNSSGRMDTYIYIPKRKSQSRQSPCVMCHTCATLGSVRVRCFFLNCADLVGARQQAVLKWYVHTHTQWRAHPSPRLALLPGAALKLFFTAPLERASLKLIAREAPRYL